MWWGPFMLCGRNATKGRTVVQVGLTGGIGSGKSAVADLLAGHGAVIIDADLLAREAVLPGTDALARMHAAGQDALGDDTRLLGAFRACSQRFGDGAAGVILAVCGQRPAIVAARHDAV